MKDEVWTWGSIQQQAVDDLKQALSQASILIPLLIPNPDLPFEVTTDAFDFAVGGVLAQDQGEGQQFVAYASHKLNSAQQNYATHEK